MGFITRFLLPREIDFNAALLSQARFCKSMVADLYKACVDNDIESLDSIITTAQRERTLKEQNMTQLLDVFITPYDKESIYRMITQLDWISLSVKHFQLEAQVYELHSLSEYEPILAVLLEMATALEMGISALPDKRLASIESSTRTVLDQYDHLIDLCAKATAQLIAQDDIRHIIRHKDMLLQLKDIAKHIHVAANTLEDMAIKVI